MSTIALAANPFAQPGVMYEQTRKDFNLEVRGSDGSFFATNVEHYFQVKSARNSQGIAKRTRLGTPVSHALTGSYVVQKSNGTAFLVEQVYQDWWFGRFLVAVLSHNGSHRTCVVENISSIDSGVIEQLQQFGNEFNLQLSRNT